jgi:hypothetical protein
MNNKTTTLNNFRPGSLLSQKGSALVSVLIIGVAFFIVIGVTLRWGVTEKSINKRHVMRHEAKNASESIVEYGFSEMVRKFTTSSSLPTNYLQANPLAITDYSFDTFYTGTSIDTAAGELYGGQVIEFPLPLGVYIDPNDPANEFDPLKGKLVRVQEVTIYGRAIATPSFGKSINSFTTQTLQVRDVPLLSHAVFYNMDLEMHSGSTMDIGGPIHSNTDIWAMAKSSGPLNLHGTVTAGGRVMHGRKTNGNHDYTGNVNIKDGSANFVSMYEGGPTSNDESWLDNRDGDWVELADQSWDGNVQDGDHGVPTLNALEVLPYIPDNPTTDKNDPDGNELENYAYSIIEPVLQTTDANYKGANVRAQKFSFKAGLTFRVTGTTPADFTVSAFRYQRVDKEDPTSDLVLDRNDNPIEVPLDDFPANVIGGAIVTGNNFTGIDPLKDAALVNTGHVDAYNAPGGGSNPVIGGMFDKRVDSNGDGALDVISLNVGTGGLKDAVESNVNWDSGGDDSSKPSSWWNGVVYVEFPHAPLDAAAQNRSGNDKLVLSSIPTVVLQTINAQEIPDPKQDSAQAAQFIEERGMSLATNSPLYITGSYNANGLAHTNDSTEPDDATPSDEPPALLAGDTTTILSANYGKNREESNQTMQWNSRTNHPTNGAHPARSLSGATYTEVSAALITGLAPTYPDGTPNADGTSSGGLHNFPRMIENWGGGIMTIRGSLVSLFESEVHPQSRPSNYTSYYRWPSRDFGFNRNFADGRYPPGAPGVRTFRRTAFKDMTRAEYDTAITNLF